MVNLSGHSKRQNQLGQGSGSRLQPIEALVSPACTFEMRWNSASTVIYLTFLIYHMPSCFLVLHCTQVFHAAAGLQMPHCGSFPVKITLRAVQRWLRVNFCRRAAGTPNRWPCRQPDDQALPIFNSYRRSLPRRSSTGAASRAIFVLRPQNVVQMF